MGPTDIRWKPCVRIQLRVRKCCGSRLGMRRRALKVSGFLMQVGQECVWSKGRSRLLPRMA